MSAGRIGQRPVFHEREDLRAEIVDYRSYHDALPVIPSCEDNEGPHERGMDYAS